MDQNKWKETLEEIWGQTCKAAMDAGDAARTGVKKAGKATEDTVQYARLKWEEADLNARVRRCLQRVGEMVYATHTGDPTDSGDMQKALEAVDALKAEISAQERALQAIRGVSVCPAGGHVNPSDHVFCSNVFHWSHIMNDFVGNGIVFFSNMIEDCIDIWTNIIWMLNSIQNEEVF